MKIITAQIKCVTNFQSIHPPKKNKCKNCKYSFQLNEETLCNKFRRITYKEDIIYINTKECRDDFNLCGEFGIYFEPKK